MKNYNKVKTNRLGTKLYYLDDKLHRTDGPACEWADGHKEWWLNGRLQPENYDRIEVSDFGTMYYLLGDKLHRTDGPAVEHYEGTKEWYIDGLIHRENAPAVEFSDGDRSWYYNGKLHREDGPAIEYNNGSRRWFLNSKEITEEEFLKQTQLTKEGEVMSEKKYAVVCEDADVFYVVDTLSDAILKVEQILFNHDVSKEDILIFHDIPKKVHVRYDFI